MSTTDEPLVYTPPGSIGEIPGVTVSNPQTSSQFLRLVGEDRWANSQPTIADVAGLSAELAKSYRTKRTATAVSNVANPTALSYPATFKQSFGSAGDLLLRDFNFSRGADSFIAGDGTYYNGAQPLPIVNAAGMLQWLGSGTYVQFLGQPLTAPNVTLSMRIESKATVSGSQFIELGFGKDSANYIGAYYDLVNGGVNFELKDAGAFTQLAKGDGSGASIAGTITFPATLSVALLDRGLAFYLNGQFQGVAEVPSSKLTTHDPLKNSVLSTWRPMVRYIGNNAADSVVASSLQLHTGARVSYREPNIIAYEDGTPIRDTNGDYFFTVTLQFPSTQLNARSLASSCWGIFRYDPTSLRLTCVGVMHESRGGSTYGLLIGKIIYDRTVGKWRIWASDVGSRAFLSSDGTNNKYWAHYYETTLCPLFGVNVFDYDNAATDLTISGFTQTPITGTSASSGNTWYDLDVSLVPSNGTLYMLGSSGVLYRCTSTDGIAWTGTTAMNNGNAEGSRIRKMGGQYLSLGGTATGASPYGYSVCNLLTNTLIGTIALTYGGGNSVVQHPNLIHVPTPDGKTIYRFDAFDTVGGSTAWSYGNRVSQECTTKGNGLEFDDILGIPGR